MSRSKKDGRRRGGHKDLLCKEFWSRRCPPVNGCRMNRDGKRITHRYERRMTARELREAVAQAVAA